jgi:hypothetical protein
LVFQFNSFFNARAVWPTVDQCGIPGPKAQIIFRNQKLVAKTGFRPGPAFAEVLIPSRRVEVWFFINWI